MKPVTFVSSLITLVALTLSFASATTYRELSLDQLLGRAELGFFGEVSQLTVREQAGEPYTQVTFDVSQMLTGEPTNAVDNTVTLSFYGGTLPSGQGVKVEGMPTFNRGDKVLLLAYNAPYYSPVVGFSQGLWRATPDGFRDLNGRLLSLNDAGNLLRDGTGSDQTAVLAAFATRLGLAP